MQCHSKDDWPLFSVAATIVHDVAAFVAASATLVVVVVVAAAALELSVVVSARIAFNKLTCVKWLTCLE